jgi:hypothetical protein
MCTVSYHDKKGVEHVVDVTADSLSVVARQPEVQHKVRIQDFERWLESHGRAPAEMSLKVRLRAPLRNEVAPAASQTRNWKR